MSKITKEEIKAMQHWCEVGILKEAHDMQINGSGFNSTITRLDNFFKEIETQASEINKLKNFIESIIKENDETKSYYNDYLKGNYNEN